MASVQLDEIPRNDYTADVLVIGGGSAGTMAAIAAAEAGAKVTLVDKAGIVRSGCAGPGNDHFLAFLNSGPAWDTREVFLDWYRKLTQGLVDTAVVDSAFAQVIQPMVKRLEEYGVPMKDSETGTYIRTKSFMQPGEYFINFNGTNIKPILTKEAAKLGVQLVRRVMITDLLAHDGEVVGAVGFNIRDGAFCTFRAKTTVLTTGGANRLYENPSGLAFNGWQSPFNTGSAQAMAFAVGATVSNMEFTNANLTPANFSASGFNAIVGSGGYIVNAMGERFCLKHHEMGEQGPRWVMPWAVFHELKEGRGPCYFDMRHLPPETIRRLKTKLLPVDKATYNDFCDQKGIDIAKDLVELQICENQVPSMIGTVHGILVDDQLKSSVERLYSAGGSSTAPCNMSAALCAGWRAGDSAGREANRVAMASWSPSEDELAALKADIYAPLRRADGYTEEQVEAKLQQLMSDYVGFARTEQGLKAGLEELRKLAEVSDEVKANDLHELMRVHELRHLQTMGKLIANGALVRRESRFGLAHFRGDYPKTDPEWHKSLLQTKDGEGIAVSFKPAC